MNIGKSEVRAPVLSGTAAAGALVEGIIKLPEGVEAHKVVGCNARMMELGATAMNEAAAVEGTVEFSVVFMNPDGTLDSVTGASGFAHRLKSPGMEPDMDLTVQGSISSPEARITSPDRISVEATAELEVQGERQEVYEVVAQVQDESSHFHTGTAYWYEKGLRRNVGLVVRDELELQSDAPDAVKILQTQANARILHIQPMHGETLVSGELDIELLYSSMEAPFIKTTLTLPFSQAVEMAESQEDMELRCDAAVSQLFVSLHDDLQSRPRLIAVEAPMELTLHGYSPRQSAIVDDGWRKDSDLVFQACAIKMQDAPMEHAARIGVSGEAYQVGIPESVEKTVVLGNAVVDGYGVTDGRAEFNGRLKLQAFYNSMGEPGSTILEVPFEGALDWECLNGDSDVRMQVCACDANLWFNNGRWQADATLDMKLTATPWVSINALSDIEQGAPYKGANAPLVLCVVQKGDTLWSLSKRCRVTSEEILRYNPDVGERGLQEGMKIVAMRR